MRSLGIAALLLSAAFGILGSQQAPGGAVRGIVRDTARIPLAGVEVLLEQRQALTNGQGVFRLDSVRVGQYGLTLRKVGYAPIRARITVPKTGVLELEYILVPAPYILPAVVTEVRRSGIYGTVADSGSHAVAGARVQVLGFRGGEVLSDSVGRFAFPEADQGAYLVRVTALGYAERRISLSLERGQGRELAIRLAFGEALRSHAAEGAFQDLRLRLAVGLRRERMVPSELARWGSYPLCEMHLEGVGNPIIVVNGVDVYENMPRSFLCLWRADELELLEYGPNLCKEASGTLRYLLPRVSCNSPSWTAGRRSGSGALSYVILWEKR